MKAFRCDHCGRMVFFENTQCVNCGHRLAYIPQLKSVSALEPAEGMWKLSEKSQLSDAAAQKWRLCANYEQGLCNWAMPESDTNPLCTSCRLTRVIPNLSLPENKDAWWRLENAKRRLIYTLLEMQLPLSTKIEDSESGLAFEFLADPLPGAPALSGHSQGVIVINIAEADDAERERRRISLHEPYRTLLGHFRHEIGHYYWDRLIQNSDRLPAFRELFGDETQDYGLALQNHYAKGPPADWQENFVSAYASAHPWEDWAETWAHYLHIGDAVETAVASGLSLRPREKDAPSVSHTVLLEEGRSFDRKIEAWFPLTYLINNLNRGLGLPDGYPFVLSAPAIHKLRFVHETIEASPPPRLAAKEPAPGRKVPAALTPAPVLAKS